MKKSVVAGILLFPIILLTANMQRLHRMAQFEQVKVAVRGYDPKDFFSGYYMNLQVDWKNTDCSQFADGVCPEKNFNPYYNFYIKKEQSDALTLAVLAERVELVFSYSAGFEPIIVDLLVNGQSYLAYVKEYGK